MNKVISREYVEKNYIHRDKIEKKIKDLEREFDGEVCNEIGNKISILKEILEDK